MLGGVCQCDESNMATKCDDGNYVTKLTSCSEREKRRRSRRSWLHFSWCYIWNLWCVW